MKEGIGDDQVMNRMVDSVTAQQVVGMITGMGV
jgi:hypothetical protein